jgi:hypothetical protein
MLNGLPSRRWPFAGKFLLVFFYVSILPYARAHPPPTDSYEARVLGKFWRWFQAQNGPIGSCCELGDGRVVDVRIYRGHYEVKFLHPETITYDLKPDPGTYYPVSDKAILRVHNPTGHAIAWWSPFEMFKNGNSLGHIRCFVSTELY